MLNPISTYRIQFHHQFTFRHFERIIDYLIKLGVHTIYASPIFESTPGSMHGYDGMNPHNIDPEIGSEEELHEIRQRVREAGMDWLQDIVPNHMAFYKDNSWLMDVLQKGRASEYASFFDILWDHEQENGRLMVPFLGGSLENVIDNGELNLVREGEKIQLTYF